MIPSSGDDLLELDDARLRARLHDLVANGRVRLAFRLLDRLDRNRQPSLFGHVPETPRVWRHRVDLLRGLGRTMEALAWVCLVCERDPADAEALAVRCELKELMDIRSAPSGPPPCPTNATASDKESQDCDERWRGVAGMQELKAVFERDVIMPMKKPWLYQRYGLTLPNGILLYGPPGCGKTFIARKLGEILGYHFVEVSPSDLGSIYVHGTQGRIRRLFDEARAKAPCLLFLDELDALLPRRDHTVSHHYAAEVNEMLVQLNRSADDRVLVIGATNRIDKLDEAAVRPGRFDTKIYVGPPDREARLQLLHMCLQDRPCESLDLGRLAGECEGLTCADIEHVVNEAARRALGRRRHIQQGDLMAALARTHCL